MPSATLTSKGQITLPKEIRDDLNLVAGSKILFVKMPNGQYNLVPKTGKISDIFGMFHYAGMPKLTIEEINEAIADGYAESGMRGMDD